jgi:hypothetical protein
MREKSVVKKPIHRASRHAVKRVARQRRRKPPRTKSVQMENAPSESARWSQN